MKIVEKKLKGVFEIILEPRWDNRGFFMRTFDHEIFKNSGIHCEWVQENHSLNQKKGIVRGLHFQFPPFAETKLVRCIRGAIFDVFVDLRKGSQTFGQWGSIELSEDNHKMILIPRGCAHGFCTLTDISDVLYKHDNYYNPEFEGGIIWNDPDIDIGWPVKKPFLSERDRGFAMFRQFKAKSGGIKI